MICINPNSIEFKQILAEVGDPLYAEVEYAKRYGADEASKIAEIEKEIKTLPIEIFNSVEVVANVSDDILGNEDISFAMKDVLNENGITDPLLINWAGINKDYFGHPKNIRSTEQLENLIKTIYNKKQKEDKYIEFKTNPLALKSFKEWKEALKEYPLAFQDAMLNHAIKHITNPQRKSKYVLQLSKVALTKAYGIVMNKPHELNRIGKLYDQEVLASVSDAVDHEPSASGNGYWVHVPRTEDVRSKKSYYALNYKTYKEFLEKTKEDIEELKPLIKELEQIKLKKPVFTTQEPDLSREDANKYGFQDYTFVRVESTYSRWNKNVTPNLSQRNQPHIEELGEDYEGYYIHGYNWDGRESKVTATKILPITKEQAEELWQAEIDRYPDNPEVGYSTKDRQEVYRLNDYKRQLKNLEEAIEKVKPEEWDIKEDDNFKVNVDLLRKLSPSTWCTASSMTEHYVANYDNYLLIVNGVTVAGIEALPSKTTRTVARFERAEDGSTYEESFENDEELFEYAKDTGEQYTILQRASNKTQVKEVTSRANNGVAPIDHLDDIIAFFKKHNLDLDNPSVKRAIKAKAEGKTDKDYVNFDDEGRYYDPFEDQEPDWEYEEPYDYEDYIEAQQQELEQQRREWQGEREFVSNITTEEEARAHINLIKSHYESLNPTFRAIKEIAEAAVFADPHNIAHVDPTLPFYNDLAISAVNEWPSAFQYLSEAGKNIPGLKQIYDTHQEELDTLPFSKTNANLIQGYYDAKNDKVVVVAANTPVNEGAKVAIHEVAHRGMLRMAKELGGVQELAKALFAAEDQLMKKLPELLKRTGHKSLQSLMLDYGFTTESKEGKIKLLMELAARWAETLTDKPKPSWWKQFIESISKWITKFTGKILNENEVNELVGGFVKYGVKTNQRFAEQASIKPGVSELFESNPELANAVYEALGFNQMITPNDKVVFGHPTIGKSFLKKQGEGRFITLDDDYKDEVNAFVDANRGSETRQEYKGRKPKEYNEFMLNLYDRLKVQAQREGKILFVSNTNILKERMSDFDKVITIPKAEFKRRFDERGATYGFEDWKSEIDATVAKVPSNKVITTTGYLADLFITPQQKQQALQQYSQYLDTIFPDSKVKDIVYRGGEKNDSKLFQYWTNNKVEAYVYAKYNITKGGNITERNPIDSIKTAAKEYFIKKYNNAKILNDIYDLDIKGINTEKITTKKKLSEIDPKILEDEVALAFLIGTETKETQIINDFITKGTNPDYLFSINSYFKNSYDNSSKIAEKYNIEKKDVELLYAIQEVFKKYKYVKIESEQDLMKKFDDTDYIENIDDYNKARKYIDNVLGVKNIKENIGKITTALLNIKNPYTEEIRQEDLYKDVAAYKNRHDGAFLMDGDHFLVKNNTNQVYELGTKQDIERFKEFVSTTSDQKIRSEQASTQFDRDRLKTINELNDMVSNFRVDEILAEKGYDVQDFISNLETANNQDELNKIINKILQLLC